MIESFNRRQVRSSKGVLYKGQFRDAKSDSEIATPLSYLIAHELAGHQREENVYDALALAGLVPTLLLHRASKTIKKLRWISYPWYVTFGFYVIVTMQLAGMRRREEADSVGLVMMAQAGYNVAGAETFWRKQLLWSYKEHNDLRNPIKENKYNKYSIWVRPLHPHLSPNIFLSMLLDYRS